MVPLLAYGLEKLSCAPWLTALLVDGVAAGVGAVLVFLPQLAALFLCLTFLEGCGYLSRGAYLLDRGVRRFGLSGKSVVPYVLSCGCGVPGILACRTIRRTSCRRLTAMTATFLPCGAKLPVIALVAGTVIPGGWWVAPLAYLVGVAAALLSSWLLSGQPVVSPGGRALLDGAARLPSPASGGAAAGDWPAAGGLFAKGGEPFAAGLGGGVVCRQLRLGSGRVW